MVLSKINFYLLQDGCMFVSSSGAEGLLRSRFGHREAALEARPALLRGCQKQSGLAILAV